MPKMPISPRDYYSDELIGHNPSKQIPELADTQPIKRVVASELIPPPDTNPEKIKFNWIAFIVMILSVSASLLVLAFVPTVFDEIIVMVIINVIYGFAQAHGFKLNKISKK